MYVSFFLYYIFYKLKKSGVIEILAYAFACFTEKSKYNQILLSCLPVKYNYSTNS